MKPRFVFLLVKFLASHSFNTKLGGAQLNKTHFLTLRCSGERKKYACKCAWTPAADPDPLDRQLSSKVLFSNAGQSRREREIAKEYWQVYPAFLLARVSPFQDKKSAESRRKNLQIPLRVSPNFRCFKRAWRCSKEPRVSCWNSRQDESQLLRHDSPWWLVKGTIEQIA